MPDRIAQFRGLISGCLALIFVFAAGSAIGAESDQALIDATKYTSISPAAVGTVTVLAPDDSEVSVRIKASLERSLRAKGYGIASQSNHSLRFEFRVERPEVDKPGVSLQGSLGSGGSRDFGLNFRVPLSPDKTPKSRYVVQARLVGGEKIKWTGLASVTLLRGRDRAEVLDRLAQGLMTTLGKNARAQRFKLRDAE